MQVEIFLTKQRKIMRERERERGEDEEEEEEIELIIFMWMCLEKGHIKHQQDL